MAFKEGDTQEVTPELANYLIRVKAAKEYKAKKQNKELKQDLETK